MCAIRIGPRPQRCTPSGPAGLPLARGACRRIGDSILVVRNGQAAGAGGAQRMTGLAAEAVLDEGERVSEHP